MPNHEDVTQWRVLIVDDDQDNLTLAAEYLKYVGAEVRIAFDGEQGLAAVREFEPTIILLDLSMPVLDGWGMLARLRQDSTFKQVPVIALTAHAMPQDREKVEAAGFDGYVTKPFMFRALVEEMKRFLTKRDTVELSDPAGSTDSAGTSDPVAASDSVGSGVPTSTEPPAERVNVASSEAVTSDDAATSGDPTATVESNQTKQVL